MENKLNMSQQCTFAVKGLYRKTYPSQKQALEGEEATVTSCRKGNYNSNWENSALEQVAQEAVEPPSLEACKTQLDKAFRDIVLF